MSPAVAAISKLAIVKTSSIAHTPLFHPHTRTLKFLHQKIRIKQEDDKAYLDERPPDVFFMGGTIPFVAFD